MQLQVTNSPFNQEQVDLLNRLLPGLTDTQKIWFSGYLVASVPAQAAVAGIASTPVTAASSVPAPTKEITILYGSQSGNGQGLSKKAAKLLEESGYQVTLSSMSDFKTNQLKRVERLLIVVSTHGEGDPPDNAISFHEFLHSKRAPKLEGLKFSVLSLGDSSYEQYCKTGKDFDTRLEALGAARFYDRVDCDVDYEEPASAWLQGVLNRLKEEQGAAAAPAAPDVQVTADVAAAESSYSRTNPFEAEVLANLNLNGRGSNKETRHIELSLEGSGLVYQPGDSLGIYPHNDPELVDLLLAETKWDPRAEVTVNKQGETRPLREALIEVFEITVSTKSLLDKLAPHAANKEVEQLLAPGNEAACKAYLKGRDLLDFIREYGPLQGSVQDIVSHLRKIPVRLYSIASSQTANPDEVHLTIGAVRYEAHGRERKGVCSTYCAERLLPGDKASVYVQPNTHFKLPQDPGTPIIMVGPGTGIAPFRGFMQEREEIGATGPSWLFFGDQHFMTDFLYQTEWQRWIKDGVLTRMDVAFSRDTEEKVYVQHRMQQHGKELFQWLEQGAVFYVCGDMKNMAKDVHRTLAEIISVEGGMSLEQAEAYLTEMKKNKRYQRDVY